MIEKVYKLKHKDWLRLLWSLSLDEHMGEVCETVEGFAKRVGLPIPDGGVDLSDEDYDEDAETTPFRKWISDQGVNSGVFG